MDIYYCVNFIKNKLLPFDSAGRISHSCDVFISCAQRVSWIASIAAGFFSSNACHFCAMSSITPWVYRRENEDALNALKGCEAFYPETAASISG